MPHYKPIKEIKPKTKRLKTIAGLENLRTQLDEEMPQKTRNSTLVLGTWNIRNFDDNRFCNGHRTIEDFYYIAEIISRFDIIAVQEICDDLDALNQLMRILGYQYDYIVSDITEGRGGNRERLGFIFDRNKVKFKGVAGELVLKDSQLIVDGEKKRQMSRTPFMCMFQSSWFKFRFSTVHIYFGASTGVKYKRRVNEIKKVAKFLAERAKQDDQNHILAGDFNILKPGSDGYNALEKAGFVIHKNNKGSNKDQTKSYDQISFMVRENELRLADSKRRQGVFQFFDSIYREEDFNHYQADLKKVVKEKIVKLENGIVENADKLARTKSKKRKKELKESTVEKKESIAKWKACLRSKTKLKDYYLSDWRTFHGSDHLPLWVELQIDFSKDYLEYLKTL